jgi:protein-S-isoprenylcysteine O-methyltransferase Ste14
LTRNPMYLGLGLVLLGLAIWQSALVGYPLVIGFCAYLTRFQIIPEERILLARFGTDFSEYVGAVRRWL